MNNPIIKKIISQDAEIYCEMRGKGPLLLFITGAMEDAGYYSRAADILSNNFTTVTYDRRCNSRSTGDRNSDMIVAQQSRDASSIIKALGFENAIVLGRSGGAIIGLELASTQPEVIDLLIAHEAPVIKLLPDQDKQKWETFFEEIYSKSQNNGWEIAQAEFMSSLINVPDTPLPNDLNDRIIHNVDFFFKHEFRTFFYYKPDIERIKNNKVNMVTATGRDSNGAYYVQVTKILASKIGCENIEFPGHHDVSLWRPEEFASAALRTINQYRHG